MNITVNDELAKELLSDTKKDGVFRLAQSMLFIPVNMADLPEKTRYYLGRTNGYNQGKGMKASTIFKKNLHKSTAWMPNEEHFKTKAARERIPILAEVICEIMRTSVDYDIDFDNEEFDIPNF